MGANDFSRFGLGAAVATRNGAPLSDALAAVRFFRRFVLAPRITAAPALVLPFGLTALDHSFKADQTGPMAPGTFDCGGHLPDADRRVARAEDQGNTDYGCTDLAVDFAFAVSGSALGRVGPVGHVEGVAAGETAPVVVALLHRRADRARGFTLRTGLIRRTIRRTTHRSPVSADAERSLLAAFGGRSFQQARQCSLGIFRDDQTFLGRASAASYASWSCSPCQADTIRGRFGKRCPSLD